MVGGEIQWIDPNRSVLLFPVLLSFLLSFFLSFFLSSSLSLSLFIFRFLVTGGSYRKALPLVGR